MKRILLSAALATILVTGTFPGYAQELTGPLANQKVKYSTPLAPGVDSPEKVETRLGTLKFFDGFPDKGSAVNPTTPDQKFASIREMSI